MYPKGGIRYICFMARIIAIDYGKKRTGLAWTDPLQIIATGLETIATPDLTTHLQELVAQEPVEGFVLGLPTRMDGSDSHVTEDVRKLGKRLEKLFPDKYVEWMDERFTSKMAAQEKVRIGMKKKQRREKGQIDRMSAIIILQEFLQSQH